MQITDAEATIIVGVAVITVPLVIAALASVRSAVTKINRSDERHQQNVEWHAMIEKRLNQGDERMNGHQKTLAEMQTQISTQGNTIDSVQEGVKNLQHGLDRVLDILLKR